MSISRNVLCLLQGHEKTFSRRFAFYLDATDEAMILQGQMGLDADAIKALHEHDQNLIQTYVLLVESGNTTWAAALRLLSSGFAADSYGLIRILYETAALLHYGNSSPPETRTELYNAIFKSRLEESEHRKQEWKFTQKATCLLEDDKPGLVPLRQELNNFGGHISRSKVVLGNLTVIGDVPVSCVFAPGWCNTWYLAGLELLFLVKAVILEEYARMQESYGGLPPGVQARVAGLTETFLSSVRPKLQAMKNTQ